MAGTDRTRTSLDGGPPVILCRPQLAENVGLAARAMLNCGLTELRLVAPREGWPSERARAASSGANAVVDGARVFASLADAVADLTDVLAATARPRSGARPVVTPRAAGVRLRTLVAAGRRPGLLVGPEREGLTTDELAVADTIVTARLNPAFASLNLAQAVLLLGYEWLEAAELPPAPDPGDPPAPKAELHGLLERLERELAACARQDGAAPHPATNLNVRELLQRARPTSRELRTLHGVVSNLLGRRRAPPPSGT
ncbi:MAG: RNA methyltransferase [Planctomycetes bacterium]|nr:RNA methyltransferase [Planctomycetota bacterium]